METRISELKKLVEDFKKRRREKKTRVEKWKKLEKTSKTVKSDRYSMQNYKRWEHFTDSEDSEEEMAKQAPVQRPKDPRFLAMEADLDKRAARKREDYKKGLAKKNKGNQYFKRGKLELAESAYSEGIEIDRNNKAIWLNRALVRLKLEKYKEAEADCTSMLEYMEYLEDGYRKSYGFAVKGFLRRASARLGMGDYEGGLGDLKKLEEVIKEERKWESEKGREELEELRKKINGKIKQHEIKEKVEKGLDKIIGKYFFLID